MGWQMVRTILVYGVLLAVASIGLQWLQFQYVVRTHPAEVYLALVALGFMGFGVWVGARLFRGAPGAAFEGNPQARQTLGLNRSSFRVGRPRTIAKRTSPDGVSATYVPSRSRRPSMRPANRTRFRPSRAFTTSRPTVRHTGETCVTVMCT